MRRPTARAKSARTPVFVWAAGAFLAVAAAGCLTGHAGDDPRQWRWPGQTVARNEEYRVPPPDDARYAQPQEFPKDTMKPVIKPKYDASAGRNPGGISPIGGGAGPMSPSARGGF